jgi:hypothetical protein
MKMKRDVIKRNAIKPLRVVFNVLKEEGEPRGISEAAISEAVVCPEGDNRIFVI